MFNYILLYYEKKITIEDADISWLVMDGREYSTIEFESVYKSGMYREFGRMMFKANGSLTIHQDSCSNPSSVGCLCGNQNKGICSNFLCQTSQACSGIKSRTFFIVV